MINKTLKKYNQEHQNTLNYYQLLWDNEIKKNIMNCLDGCYNVAFVLPHWASKEQKRAIRKSYQTEDRKVFVIDFEELKDGVRADMVVFFAYRYTDSKYKNMKTTMLDELKKAFRPEFLNRIDEMIVFHSLEKEQLKEINEKYLGFQRI